MACSRGCRCTSKSYDRKVIAPLSASLTAMEGDAGAAFAGMLLSVSERDRTTVCPVALPTIKAAARPPHHKYFMSPNPSESLPLPTTAPDGVHARRSGAAAPPHKAPLPR